MAANGCEDESAALYGPCKCKEREIKGKCDTVKRWGVCQSDLVKGKLPTMADVCCNDKDLEDTKKPQFDKEVECFENVLNERIESTGNVWTQEDKLVDNGMKTIEFWEFDNMELQYLKDDLNDNCGTYKNGGGCADQVRKDNKFLAWLCCNGNTDKFIPELQGKQLNYRLESWVPTYDRNILDLQCTSDTTDDSTNTEN